MSQTTTAGGRRIITGKLPAELANAVSDALDKAQKSGMTLDEAVCVALGVAADYARIGYGDSYLLSLCYVIMDRGGKPHPKNIAALAKTGGAE